MGAEQFGPIGGLVLVLVALITGFATGKIWTIRQVREVTTLLRERADSATARADMQQETTVRMLTRIVAVLDRAEATDHRPPRHAHAHADAGAGGYWPSGGYG